MTREKMKVAVLGGGLAGLEAAIALVKDQNIEVDVIERGSDARINHVGWDSEIYPGDEKTQRWTSSNWGAGGGLNERLGGRSLCYHGVLLGIEPNALASWPSSWQQDLMGQDGLYAEILHELTPQFPELIDTPFSAMAQKIGLRHVPQAGLFDMGTGLFRAYSPLDEALRRKEAGDLNIIKDTAQRIRPQKDGRWSVEMIDPSNRLTTKRDYIACVLAASAIGNVQILAASLGRDMQTTITDHFGIGALARLSGGNPIDTFRHGKIWSGYLPLPSLGANIFVQEMAPLSNGDRLIDASAVIEQGSAPKDYSTLYVSNEEFSLHTHIEATVSSYDEEKMRMVRDKIFSLVNQIAGNRPPRLITGEDDSYDTALSTTMSESEAAISFYRFPYGSFEHESSTHPMGGGSLGVSPELEVEELPGVFVAGPGSFPRPGAANPALTIIALSRAIARTIRGRYS